MHHSASLFMLSFLFNCFRRRVVLTTPWHSPSSSRFDWIQLTVHDSSTTNVGLLWWLMVVSRRFDKWGAFDYLLITTDGVQQLIPSKNWLQKTWLEIESPRLSVALGSIVLFLICMFTNSFNIFSTIFVIQIFLLHLYVMYVYVEKEGIIQRNSNWARHYGVGWVDSTE